MPQSPPITNLNPYLLTERETLWVFGVRWLMFGLSILGVLCAFAYQYAPNALLLQFAFLFGFVFPMVATLSGWITRVIKIRIPLKFVLHPRNCIFLVGPVFWLPILDHVLYPIKQYYQKRADNQDQSIVDEDQEVSSFRPPNEKNRSMVGNLQNSVPVALTTTFCQAYSSLAFDFF